MIRPLVVALFSFAAAAVTLPAFAQTPAPVQAPPSPIIVDNCGVDYAQGPFFTKSVNGLRIKFTNEGDKPASVVRFAVNFEGHMLNVRDVGTFAPNITVDHRFRDLVGQNMKFLFSHETQPKCAVSFIKFADGTMWQGGEQVDEDPSPAPETFRPV